MFLKMLCRAAAVSVLTGMVCLVPLVAADQQPNRHLLIVVDGMRPDYITPERMPNLHALGEQGVFGEKHSVAFPSVTRVNSATVSTGSYPATHGMMHNTMLVPEIPDGAFGTGSARNLRRLDEATGGKMLTAPSLGEILDENNLRLFVTGSGGSGNSLLQNPRGSGMGIWTAGGFFVPADAHDEAIETVGELEAENSARTVWAFDSYLSKALSDDPPEVVIMWINEPDSAGHRHGVGSPEALAAAANFDAQLGRIVEMHEEHGLTDRVNIFVTTDHGFTTNIGRFSVSRTIRDGGFGDEDVSVVSNMVYLHRDDPDLLARVVQTLQRDEETGNIYTRPARPGSSEGIVPGTLSTAVIQWDHPRAADIIVTPAWSHDVNEFGFAGATTRSGVASHGSDSPYDLQVRMVAAGPDIKSGIRSDTPTGNVDFVPTILHLLGIESRPKMDGRVLYELLKDGPAPEEVRVHEHTHAAAVTLPGGFRYKAELDTLTVGDTTYVREARTSRP